MTVDEFFKKMDELKPYYIKEKSSENEFMFKIYRNDNISYIKLKVENNDMRCIGPVSYTHLIGI